MRSLARQLRLLIAIQFQVMLHIRIILQLPSHVTYPMMHEMLPTPSPQQPPSVNRNSVSLFRRGIWNSALFISPYDTGKEI